MTKPSIDIIKEHIRTETTVDELALRCGWHRDRILATLTDYVEDGNEENIYVVIDGEGYSLKI